MEDRSRDSRTCCDTRIAREASTRNQISRCPRNAEAAATHINNTSNDDPDLRHPSQTKAKENIASIAQSATVRNAGACISCAYSHIPVWAESSITIEYKRTWYGVTSVASAHNAVRPISFFQCKDPHAIIGRVSVNGWVNRSTSGATQARPSKPNP